MQTTYLPHTQKGSYCIPFLVHEGDQVKDKGHLQISPPHCLDELSGSPLISSLHEKDNS